MEGISDVQLTVSIITIVLTPLVTFLTIKYEYKKMDREFALERRKIDFENKYETINRTILQIGEYMIKLNNYFESVRGSDPDKASKMDAMSSELYNDAKNIVIMISLIFDNKEGIDIVEQYHDILGRKDTVTYLSMDRAAADEKRAEEIKACLELSESLKDLRDQLTVGK